MTGRPDRRRTRSPEARARGVLGAVAAVVVSTSILTACSPASSPAAEPDRARSARSVGAETVASFLAANEKLYSQKNEELLIRHFFSDRRDGVFLDVGCYHWQKGSTTLYLEKRLGWTGIGVDALESMRDGYAAHRPGTRFFNYVVSDSSQGEATIHVAGPVSSTDPGWKDRFSKARDRTLEQVSVPRITLDDLLAEAGLIAIDFLSMDIEGGERAALTGFDIRRFSPELVCIEKNPENRDWIFDYFARAGYERIMAYRKHDRINWYFRRRDEDH